MSRASWRWSREGRRAEACAGVALPAWRPCALPGQRGARPMWPAQVEVRGRTGPVERVERYELRLESGYWRVIVNWQLGGSYPSFARRGEELEPADAHRRPGRNPLGRL